MITQETQTVRTDQSTALELNGVTVGYGPITVLRDVNITVPTHSVLALIGPNGAGKTTLLRAASGLLKPSSGVIRVHGIDVTSKPAHQHARAGLCLIPDGRGVFPSLSVRENLLMQVPPWEKDKSLDPAIEAFPILGERIHQRAGTLSGGQQQMLALARCFLSKPSVVLLDEVSMGLAPKIVDEIFVAIRGLAAEGVALLLVEQYIATALEMADTVCVLGRGAVTYDGPPDGLDQDALISHYIGLDDDEDGGPEPAIL